MGGAQGDNNDDSIEQINEYDLLSDEDERIQ